MILDKKISGNLLEIAIRGSLDNDSAIHFREEIEAVARDGWHHILVDLSGVAYLSSAGIGALVGAKKRLAGLNGFFGIHELTLQIEEVLSTTRVLDMLRCDPKAVRAAGLDVYRPSVIITRPRFAVEQGLNLEFYTSKEVEPLKCRVVGNPRAVFDPTHRHRQEVSASRVVSSSNTFGVGLGAIGNNVSEKTIHGEILAAAGAVAQSPLKDGGLPDYSLVTGDFVPEARLLYGFECEGDLSTLVRFTPTETSTQVDLSTLVQLVLRQTGLATAGMIFLAESAGLVGAQMRRLPSGEGVADQFALPGIRDWLSFSAEKIHRRKLVLIVGIATLSELPETSPLAPLLRPLGSDSEKPGLSGHFHAAVFPFRLFKKGTLQLQPSITELFQSGTIQDVLHLLRDDRPIHGLGESDLLNGACWIGPIDAVTEKPA